MRARKNPTPEELAKMSPALQHYYKTRLDPEVKARRNANSAKWYEEKKDDPEYKEKRRSQQRKAWKEWRRLKPRCASQQDRKFIYSARYYEKNASRISMMNKRDRQARRYYVGLWREVGCQVCGQKHSIDAHHIDPSTKVDSLGAMCRYAVAWPKLIAEMKKCAPICSVCHHRITHEGFTPDLHPVENFDYEGNVDPAKRWADENFPIPNIVNDIDEGVPNV